MDGTDITEKLTRRYSDFYSLYEKLIQRWPGIYVPRIPPKKITGNLDPSVIKTRMRLLNRFCLNLSNIEYLYKSEEAGFFRNNIPDVSNAINKLPELPLSQILERMKEAFPEYNGNYDIIIGSKKIEQFDLFLKNVQKSLDDFNKSVEAASEKREIEKKQYLELIKNFTNYEKENMLIYADNNENSLIFNNPSYNSLSEKIIKLKQEMVNPFMAFKDWIQEETLDVEAMQYALKQINQLLETEEKLKSKLKDLQESLDKGQQGVVNMFKSLFKKKEDIAAETQREKEITSQKIQDIEEIIKIVGDNMENQIEIFKNDKTQNYYKYLKIFAIMQRESNRVIRELWTLVKNALNDIVPNIGEENDYPQNNEHEQQDYEQEKAQEEPEEQNEIHENENLDYQEPNEEQPPQKGEGEGEGGDAEE